MVTDRRPVVLFVCAHNAGRSQMAAGYLGHLAGDQVEVLSAGSDPADLVNPVAVEAMAEVHAQLDEAIGLVPHPEEVLRRSNQQHRALIVRLRKRDVTAAVKLIREHVEGTEYFLAGMLAD